MDCDNFRQIEREAEHLPEPLLTTWTMHLVHCLHCQEWMVNRPGFKELPESYQKLLLTCLNYVASESEIVSLPAATEGS